MGEKSTLLTAFSWWKGAGCKKNQRGPNAHPDHSAATLEHYVNSGELLHSQCAPSPCTLHPSDTQWRHHLAVWSTQMLGKDRSCRKAEHPMRPVFRIRLNHFLPDLLLRIFLVTHKPNSHPCQSGSVDLRLHSERARPACSNHCCKISTSCASCSHKKSSMPEYQQNKLKSLFVTPLAEQGTWKDVTS